MNKVEIKFKIPFEDLFVNVQLQRMLIQNKDFNLEIET